MDFKGTDNNEQDILAIINDHRLNEIKGLKMPFVEKSISKDLKGPKRTVETLIQVQPTCILDVSPHPGLT